MGLFERSKRGAKIDWVNLNEMYQLDKILETSKTKPVVIFKHSTRCPVSSIAKSKLEQQWDLDKEFLDVYYLDLIRYREISNAIASKLAVDHQSPQAILVKDGISVYDASHEMIEVKDIKKHL